MSTDGVSGPSSGHRLIAYRFLIKRLSWRELARRGVGFAQRRVRALALRTIDYLHTTYAPSGETAFVRLRVGDFSGQRDALPDLQSPFVEHYLAHRFDLLGSGWTHVAFPASHDGAASESFLGRGNRRVSLCVRAKIGAGAGGWTYQPIDWHGDFKSRFRWPHSCHYSKIPISPGRGIDIKLPWELARMQHLPQLAVAAVWGQQRDSCAAELRAQILDFIASNPPRFGVNWACPMDVAIRIANCLLAVDILRLGESELDIDFLETFTNSVREHARHIVANLEWAEEPRTNHYLADIVGLMFSSVYLFPDDEAKGWLAFSVREFIKELRLQFHADGGSYEASSGYHRLSAEMAVYGTALLLGLGQDELRFLENPPPRRLHVRPTQCMDALPLFALAGGEATVVPPEIVDRLARMAELVADITKSDGLAVMIGDQDSGRFFKIDPAVMDDAGELRENPLDFRHLLSATGALLGRADLNERAGRDWLDGRLVRALAKNRFLASPQPFPAHGELIGNRQALLTLRERLLGLPDAYRRVVSIFRREVADDAVQHAAYPDFGVYVLQGFDFFVSVRCFDPSLPGVYGHSHDDNLALELQVDGEDLVIDPGTLAYTSDPELRDLYRSAGAHFVPRVENRCAMKAISPFLVRHDARAVCLGFDATGFAGRLEGDDWTVTRLVLIESDRILVIDGSDGGKLAPVAENRNKIGVAVGYGRKTERSICRI